MKIIVLGDTHGRGFWKQVVHTEKFDKIILLGDYFDSFDIDGPTQLRNFWEIMEYKEANPDKMICLIGNHDCHYLPQWMNINESYSGFNRRQSFNFRQALLDNMKHLQMCHIEGKFMFTHAGVTRTWFNYSLGLEPEMMVDTGVDMAEYVNNIFKYTPRMFYFRGTDPYGDDVTQSPIWVRPQSLMSDPFPGYHQVVGHTSTGILNPDGIGEEDEDKFFFIDCLGTSGEYLIIEDGKTYKAKV